jgi:pantothenate kinase
VVGADDRLLIVEGNYLLLDADPWAQARSLYDLTIALDVPEAELERRLIARWLDHGHDADAARARALSNDIPNARRVVRESVPADIVIHQPG